MLLMIVADDDSLVILNW